MREFGLGSSLRRPATAKALPVYLQEPTYLRTAGTAGQCQKLTSRVLAEGLSENC
jgi:hypothetical protein